MSDPITRLNAALQGRYRIERQLGEGGMATVYLAEDLKHKREVALKVLKPELAAVVGAERFLAEIETTANLQHPHILPLFDSGEADGFLFYVMPRVDGESLRERIDREHQLPVDEAVAISTKVAGALQAAHDRGVIHRDIKPANILLAKGEPLVSDFGIALAVSAGGAGRLTETGLSLGTPHYMSPEQATGDTSVGPATDVYALGCVLYEMLVGEPPYTGSTPQAILGKIIQAEPLSPTKVRRSVPAHVDAVIRKALEKIPADRFAGADDFATALADPGFTHGAVGVPAGVVGPRWKRLAIGATAAAAAFALLFAWSLTRGGGEAAPLNRRFELGVGALAPLPFFNSSAELAISRDGSKIAYTAMSDSRASLHVRSLDQTETRVFAGTGSVYSPFFSPDGEWIGYLDPVANEVKKISVQGGQPIVLAPLGAPPLGGTWLDDGTIVFSSGRNPSLFRVPEAGGTPVQLTQAEPGTAHFFPEALPGGRAILFSMFSAFGSGLDLGSGRIDMLSLETGEVRTIVDVGYDAHYLPSGHLVFARQGSLWAIPFDPRSGQTSGQAVVVLQGVEMSSGDRPTAAFSPQGLMVYLPGEAAGAATSTAARPLVWVDEDGAEEPLPLPARQYAGPRLSPDGTRLAVAVFDGEAWALWAYDVASGAALRLTQAGGSANMAPVWTPDGSRIFYRATGGPTGDLYSIPSDGSGGPQRITNVENAGDSPMSISPDGTTVIFIRILDPGPSQHREIWAVAADGSGEARPILQGDFAFGNAALSPDGRWLAYRSDESGQYEIYLQPYPGPGAKTPVSIGGGNWVVWSHDGSTIYYQSAGRFMAAEVTLGTSARVGRPRELFPDTAYYQENAGGLRQYDVGPDGRLLLIRRVRTTTTDDNAHLVVVENWLAELERLVPTGR
jgi:Tol biopolymer transport system component